MRKITVALNFPEIVGKAITYAKHIAERMTGNASFPSPPIPIATLLAQIAELEDAHIATKSGTHGAAATRNAKYAAVHNTMKVLRTYVQYVANQHGQDGLAVVASSGMFVKQVAGPSKAMFAGKQMGRPDWVKLSVRHPGGAASFYWQYGTDGIHWIERVPTTEAEADIEGLTPGTVYLFRYRVLTKDGLGDWSDPISLLVG